MLPEPKRGRPAKAAAGISTAPNLAAWFDDYLLHFQQRVVQDAFAEASANYWLRRAASFEAAMPRPDDFPGRATLEDLEGQRKRLLAVVLACRRRAAVALIGGRL